MYKEQTCAMGVGLIENVTKILDHYGKNTDSKSRDKMRD